VGGFGFGLDIEVHNFKFSDTDWIWSLWKKFWSNPIAKFPYPYTTAGESSANFTWYLATPATDSCWQT